MCCYDIVRRASGWQLCHASAMAQCSPVMQHIEGACKAGVTCKPHLLKEYSVQQRADVMRFITVYGHRKLLHVHAVDIPAAQRCNRQHQGAQAPIIRPTHVSELLYHLHARLLTLSLSKVSRKTWACHADSSP